MANVAFTISMSLDGCIAASDEPGQGPGEGGEVPREAAEAGGKGVATGGSLRLCGGPDGRRVMLERTCLAGSPGATHLRFRVVKGDV